MRILLVSSSSGSRGGGEIFLVYLAEALKDAGHEPLLWCADHPRMDELAERFVEIGQVFRSSYPNSYLDRRGRVFSAVADHGLSRRLASELSAIPWDVAHLNKQSLEDGLDLLAALKTTGRPWVGTIHITQSSRELGAVGGCCRDFVARRVLRRAAKARWSAVSDARADSLRDFLGDRVTTIYNAVSEAPRVDREDARQSLLDRFGWPEPSVVVTCVARLVAQKDPFRFLSMAKALHERDRATRFVWIGDGDLRERFESEARRMGLAGVVVCSGWTAEPRSLLPAADLYLHPAAYEGLPLAILEAMAAGLPCVLSPQIAAEVAVFDESNVILGTGQDRAWVDLASSPADRKRLGEASRSLYERHFQPGAMAASYGELYRAAFA